MAGVCRRVSRHLILGVWPQGHAGSLYLLIVEVVMPLTRKRGGLLFVVGACVILLAGCESPAIPNIKLTDTDTPRGGITKINLVHLRNAPGSELVIYAS